MVWFEDHEIIRYIPVPDRAKRIDGKLTREAFKHDPEREVLVCPLGHELRFRSDIPERRLKRYQGDKKACGACPIKVIWHR